MDRLISAARSCAFMWGLVYQFSTALKGQVKLSKSTASPWATNGHPRIPLTLVGTMPVNHLPLAGCSRTSWSSKPFERAGPHFHLSNFCRCSLIPVHRAAYPKFHRVLGQPRPVVTLSRPYLYRCHLLGHLA